MQPIAFLNLLSNHRPEKCGFRAIKRANPEVRIHPSKLWFKSNIAGFLGFQKYRFVGDSVPRGCTGDEGRSLGVGLQEQASNHLKLLWSKATVVSVEEKSRHQIAAGRTQRDECKRTIRWGVERIWTRSKLGFYIGSRMSLGATCLLPKRPPA